MWLVAFHDLTRNAHDLVAGGALAAWRLPIQHQHEQTGHRATGRADSRTGTGATRGYDRGAMTPEEAKHLRRAKDLVDRSYAQPLDVAALARHAHVSPAHFSRRFKEAFGETPYQYVLSRRVERAQELLRNTDLTVTDICLEVGFQSLGSFSSAFHRVAGMSPTAYRATVEGFPPTIPGCWAAQWTRPMSAGIEKRPAPAAD